MPEPDETKDMGEISGWNDMKKSNEWNGSNACTDVNETH